MSAHLNGFSICLYVMYVMSAGLLCDFLEL